MSLRQQLLLLLSLTVAAAVAAVAWTVLVRIRHVFEERDQQETALFVSQFQREFQHRSTEVAAAVDRLAAGERARSMAFQMIQSGDTSIYVNEAQSMAQDAQLDFLEIVGPDGNVVSSAQWPARFGYPEPAANAASSSSFLKREELPDGASTLGIFAVRRVHGADLGAPRRRQARSISAFSRICRRCPACRWACIARSLRYPKARRVAPWASTPSSLLGRTGTRLMRCAIRH